MATKKQKYYVVWVGIKPGVYDNWADCKKQVDCYLGARYKSFETIDEANQALADGWETHVKLSKQSEKREREMFEAGDKPVMQALAVDAACSGNPGNMEYRGVLVENGQEIFRIGPYKQGTNNIGEFLAIAHGLAVLKKKNCPYIIYSDSENAISWIRQRKCKTKLEENEINKPLFDLVRRAEAWLNNNTYTTEIRKWQTKLWGEIPADFGRK